MTTVRAVAGTVTLMLLAGCGAASGRGPGTGGPVTAGSATGRVSGRLLIEGGPLGPGGQQPGQRPVPGTVTFSSAGRRPVSVPTGPAGTFTVRLRPGRYRVSGQSPRIVEVSGGSTRQRPCSQPMTVTVTAGHAVTITLTCIVP